MGTWWTSIIVLLIVGLQDITWASKYHNNSGTTTTIPNATEFVKDSNYRSDVLNRILVGSGPHKYDPTIPPFFDQPNPTTVTVEVYLESVNQINEQNMIFDATFFFRTSWIDRRLKFVHMSLDTPYLALDPKKISSAVWKPDIYFRNEKSGHIHTLMTHNELLRIYNNGRIMHSARLSVRFACPMNFRNYPMDEQRCSIRIESYSYSKDELLFEWENRTSSGVAKNKDISLSIFRLLRIDALKCDANYGSKIGDFPCLEAVLHMVRDIQYYLVQIYLPSVLIVLLSWIGFWISHDAVPARLSLSVITVLTMTTQASGVMNRLPPVNYVKAIDVWLSTCLIFVFAALLQYAIVNISSRRVRRKKKKQEKNQQLLALQSSDLDELLNKPGCAKTNNEEVISSPTSPTRNAEETDKTDDSFDKIVTKRAALSHRITHIIEKIDTPKGVDLVARYMFPFSFFMFNVIYWGVYVNIRFSQH